MAQSIDAQAQRSQAAAASFSHVVRNGAAGSRSSEPLHQQLYRQIREELESGSSSFPAKRSGITKNGGSIITYRLGYRCELPVEFLPH